MLGQARNTQRRNHRVSPEEARLVADVTALATRYGKIRLSADYSTTERERLAGEPQ